MSNNKNPPIRLKKPQRKNDEYRINVDKGYKGSPDRVTVSLGTKIEGNSIFFSYSSDVGAFSEDESLIECTDRVKDFVAKQVKKEAILIKQSKKE